jgi:DNA-binding response OmpR family regulator
MEIGIRELVMKSVVESDIDRAILRVLGKKRARILVIDDDEQIRAMLRQMLERSGYKVAEAPDGKEGIRLFREKPADLVITDLIMPWGEGIETIMELKRDFPRVKVIAISGGGMFRPDDYLLAAKEFGADRTFTKPVKQNELLKAVRELLK